MCLWSRRTSWSRAEQRRQIADGAQVGLGHAALAIQRRLLNLKARARTLPSWTRSAASSMRFRLCSSASFMAKVVRPFSVAFSIAVSIGVIQRSRSRPGIAPGGYGSASPSRFFLTKSFIDALKLFGEIFVSYRLGPGCVKSTRPGPIPAVVAVAPCVSGRPMMVH